MLSNRNLTLGLILFLMLASISQAIPQLMNYQGRLTDSSGGPITTATTVEFRIYDAATAGTVLWMESQSVTPDDDGLFSVMLGSVNSLPDSAFAPAEAYLGIKVGADSELAPRILLVRVPYSLFASKADYSDSTDAITDGAIHLSDIGQNDASINQILKWNGTAWTVADDDTTSSWKWSDSSSYGPDSVFFAQAARSNGGWTDDGPIVRLTDSSAKVGVGTQAPTVALDVRGDFNATGAAIIGPDNQGGSLSFVVGKGNKVFGRMSTIAGGGRDTSLFYSDSGNVIGIYSDYAFIGGGQNNQLVPDGDWAVIGGGRGNKATAPLSSVLGGGWYAPGDTGNIAGDTGAVVVGGISNTATGYMSFVGGGMYNRAEGRSSVVCGGAGIDFNPPHVQFTNTATGHFSFLGGGANNIAGGYFSAIVGGILNQIEEDSACFIGGGKSNMISLGGKFAVITGGANNKAGLYATVPGGYSNHALGSFSFAAGKDARALHTGSFVWADSSNADFASTNQNQFLIRASNGVGINTSFLAYTLHVNGTIGGNGGLYHSSDRRWKDDIESLTNSLDKVMRMRGVNYKWKVDEYPDQNFSTDRQIGFIAQELKEILPEVVMEDANGYMSADYSRLTPILVEALKEIKAEKEVEINALQKQIDELRKLVTKLASKSVNTESNYGMK